MRRNFQREGGDNSGFKSDYKLATKELSPSKVESSRASNSRTSDIVCFKCGGRGHKKFECPNERRGLLTEEGYMSASDGEKILTHLVRNLKMMKK